MKNIIKGPSDNVKAMMQVVLNQAYEEGFVDGQALTVEEKPVIKTEKRRAKVGERILVNNVKTSKGNYVNEIFTVSLASHLSGRVDVEELIDDGYSYRFGPDEYEVIIEDEPAPLPANQQRSETIQRAREFVEKYQANRHGAQDGHGVGNSTARSHFYETDFFTKDNKVTAVVYRLLSGRERLKKSSHVGRSICSIGDVFNEWIGKAIALARALGIDIPKEFTDVVQPDEVVVGMVTKNTITDTTCVVTSISLSGRIYRDNEEWSSPEFLSIIDDTNAIYSV